jgi:hypothetical protein
MQDTPNPTWNDLATLIDRLPLDERLRYLRAIPWA